MKTLIAEDSTLSRISIEKHLIRFGIVDNATNGEEVLELFLKAHKNGVPYNLICLDIMMPRINGQKVLAEIRNIEDKLKIYLRDTVKIIMISSLNDNKNIMLAFRNQCDGYLVKPIDPDKLLELLHQFKIID